MMRFYLVVPPVLVFLSVWLTFPGPDPTVSSLTIPYPLCAADQYRALRFQQDADNQLVQEQMDKAWAESGPAPALLPNELVLPVVVHVVHNNGPENITSAQVQQGIQDLNDAFANIGPYNPATGVAVPIQFCLAQRDPEGMATDGINYLTSSFTEMTLEEDDLELKDLSRWDPTCYLNIWVVATVNTQTTTQSVEGYSSFPFDHGLPTDGIVIEADYFGTSPENSVVLVHEMGHYLGLYHTFQGGCLNDFCMLQGDQVCDTPPDQSTAPLPCTDIQNTCSTDANSGLPSDLPDLTNNYLDYGQLQCMNAFTPGQSDRMLFFVENVRSSLLHCSSCLEPCPDNLEAMIQPPSLPIELGVLVNFSGNTQDITDWEWTIEGNVVGSAATIDYTFTQEGNYWVALSVFNNDPSCQGTDSVLVHVTCPVYPQFSPASLGCIDAGESLTFQNLSTNASSFEWLLDGVLVSTETDLQIDFPTNGTYLIELWASNGSCERVSSPVIVHVGCTENCDNGYDDDNDGLVDCFDPDCYCEGACEEYYFNPCFNFCQEDAIDLSAILPEIDWVSSYDQQVSSLENAVVGDLDRDGVPEVVIRGQGVDAGKWLVFNGDDGSLKFELDNVWATPFSATPVIGDVDLDGFGEIVFAGANDANPSSPYFIHCFEHDGTPKYTSTTSIPSQYVNPVAFVNGQFALSDLDMDGYPELIVGKQIYSAQTGDLLLSGAADASLSRGTPVQSFNSSDLVCLSVAADVLPDGFCTNCTGKELVVGNQVLGINLNTGEFSIETEAPPGYGDGFTSLADLDGDGDLDGVVISRSNGQNVIYGWDLQSDALIGHYDLPDGTLGFQPAIADFDGDSQVEIAIVSNQHLHMISHDFQLQWTLPLSTQNPSGLIPTAFDFENDQQFEVVLRDAEFVRIIDGSTGGTLWQEYYPGAGGLNYCLIADIDGDGLTEILTHAQLEDGGPQNVLVAFQSGTTPWAAARPVWNQQSYFMVNVEDDLEIHAEIQDVTTLGTGQELNTFLTQVPLSGFWAPDAAWDYAYVDCFQDSMALVFKVCNVGKHILSAQTPISIYNGDPTNSNPDLLAQIALGANLTDLECQFLDVVIPASPNLDLYLVLNDPGTGPYPFTFGTDFPLTAIRECEYANNMTTVSYNYDPPSLDLGPDIANCEFQVTVLEADDGFASYVWQDGFEGQMYTATSPGTYWVVARDACGLQQADTVIISVAEDFILGIGQDTVICPGDSVEVSVSGYDNYAWSPATGISCVDCPDVVFYPDSSTTYVLVATTADGCYGSDSLTVIVPSAFSQTDTLQICEGDSALIFGVMQTASGTWVESYPSAGGCDSTISITLEVLESLSTTSNWSICAGDTATLFGQGVTVAGYYEETFVSEAGCDSVVGVWLEVLDTVATTEMISICAGEEIDLWGTPVSDAGWYSATFPASTGCDSTHAVQVTVESTYQLSEHLEICAGDSVEIFGTFESTAGTYSASFPAVNGCDSLITVHLEVLDTLSSFEEMAICAGDSIWLFGAYQSTPGTYAEVLDGSNGCDSVARVELVVLENSSSYTYLEICAGETASIFGSDTALPGIYEQILENAIGCDSLIQIELAVLDTFLHTDTVILCEGETVDLWGMQVGVEGWYAETFAAGNTCDSTVRIWVEVLEVDHGAEFYQICQGDSVEVFGSYVSSSGLFEMVFPDENGCDSLHTVEVVILDTLLSTSSLTICQGDSVNIFGNYETAAGTYEATFTSSTGCDSTSRIELVLTIPDTTLIPMAICAGDSLEVFGNYVFQPGLYEQLFDNQLGCDSLVQVELQVLDTVALVDSVVLCFGETILLWGTEISEAGWYSQQLVGSNGCDSTIYLEVSILDELLTTEQQAICWGDSSLIFGSYVSEAGIYVDTLTSTLGCDSIHVVELAVEDTSLVQIHLQLCAGDSLWLFDQYVAGAGTYEEELSGWNGCDSTILAVVTEIEVVVTEESVSVCEGESVVIFGQSISVPGIFSDTLQGINGCDSVHTVFLSVNPLPEVFLEVDTACWGSADGSILVTPGVVAEPLEYTWGHTASDAEILSELEAGWYYLTVTDGNGCSEVYEIEVPQRASPEQIILTEPATCGQANGILWVENGTVDLQYSINGGAYQADPVFTGLPAGNYVLEILSADGCVFAQTIQVDEVVLPMISLADNYQILLGDSVQLQPQVVDLGGGSYSWVPTEGLSCTDCLEPVAAPQSSTTYELEISYGDNCSVRATTRVEVDERIPVYLANVFSPDFDGINEIFKPQAAHNYPILYFRVFDRWGNMLYEERQTDLNSMTGWDGTRQGQMVNPGVYLYLGALELPNGKVLEISGDVTVLR